MTATALRPWTSGHCSGGAPGGHDRCRGFHTNRPDGTPVPCSCTCHLTPPQETPMTDDPATDPLHEAIDEALRAAADVDTAAKGLDRLIPYDALVALDTLREAIETLRKVDASLVRHIYLTADHGKQVIDGIGEVFISRTRAHTVWNTEAAARAVIDVKMQETDGEAPDPWDVAEWLLSAASVGYFRKTALRDLGIEPRGLYEDEPGKPSVTLPSRD